MDMNEFMLFCSFKCVLKAILLVFNGFYHCELQTYIQNVHTLKRKNIRACVSLCTSHLLETSFGRNYSMFLYQFVGFIIETHLKGPYYFSSDGMLISHPAPLSLVKSQVGASMISLPVSLVQAVLHLSERINILRSSENVNYAL